MIEQPLFIETFEQKIFAIVHSPEDMEVKGAFVFCHPFAEEKLWSHRAYVSFARALTKQGYIVVRFDMRGHGDSQGEFSDFTIENHIEDTLAIVEYIKKNYESVANIGLFGLRLGGTIAALAAEKSDEIKCLILWEPVCSGERYMQEMLRSNLAAQMAIKGKVEITREELINDMKSGKPVNVEGYPITYQYFSKISDVNLFEVENKSSKRCLINQVVRNEKQPLGKEFLKLQDTYKCAELVKSQELQFWREIKEFYSSANILTDSTISWLEGSS